MDKYLIINNDNVIKKTKRQSLSLSISKKEKQLGLNKIQYS